MQLKHSLFLVLVTFSLNLHSQEIFTWDGPSEMVSDKYYSVFVNGVSVPVFDTPVASYAIFDFTGTAYIEVKTMFDVRWVDIRPTALNIGVAYKSDNSFSFSLKNPSKVSVELNGRIRQQPLFILAGRPEVNIPDRNNPDVIWFEKGKLYKNTVIELTDNQTVYIEGGAVVQGWIHANGKKNIKITGRGILDGTFNRETPGNRNRFINLTDCENAEVSGITLHNGTTWQVALFNCTGGIIRDVRIISENGGDDGIDIFRCRKILVEDIFAHTKDDCIAIKSGGNYPSIIPTDSITVRNCVFWNSLWGNAIEVGFELYSNEVKNIRFENIDIIHVEDGATLSIHNAGQALVKNIIFENIRVEDSRQKLIDVAIFFSQWGPDGIREPEFIKSNYLHGAWDGVQKMPAGKEEYHSQFRGRIDNITFRNISVTGGLLPFSVFHGFSSDKNVTNVTIENLTYMGRRLTNTSEARIRMQNTENLVIR